MTTVTFALALATVLLLLSLLWLVDDRYTPTVPDRWPTAPVTKETP